jgi:phosphate transport system permease protein
VDLLRLVPDALREASLGAGATRAQTIMRVVVPAASAGIITGIMLAVARVAGETAPLLFTALGNDGNVFDPNRPYPSLTLKIFSYATSADDEWKRQAWAGMLVLIILIFVLNLLVRVFSRPRLAVKK